MRFLARPTLQADTLSFVPYPWQEVLGSRMHEPQSSVDAAIEHQRRLFRSITLEWSAALPASATAKESGAVSLEMLGDPTAADTLELARRLSTDPAQQLALASRAVMLRIKLALPDRIDQLRSARALGDSLLAAHAQPSQLEAKALLPIATITGRCALAAKLARTAAEPFSAPMTMLVLPRHLIADRDALIVRAAMRCSVANDERSLDDIAADAGTALGRSATLEQHRLMEYSLLGQVVGLREHVDARWISRLAAPSHDYILEMRFNLLRGKNAQVRQELGLLATERRARSLSGVQLDAVLAEAQLLLAMGDSVGAAMRLDDGLDAMRQLAPAILDKGVQSASLFGSLKLRTSLHLTRGDSKKALAWKAAYSTLSAP